MSICAALALGIHLGTYHFDRNRGYEEFNPGAYVRCDNITAGAYRNSEGKPSVYAGYTGRPFASIPLDVTVGGVTGYRRSTVVPLLVPSVRIGDARLSLLLPLEKGGGGVHLSWEF